jgi:uncharacterized protein YbjT (DUF2867 family)
MILLTGGTGNVGSEAARLLAARHQSTRALVRDPARAPHGDIETATGDFDRPDTLDAAMRGIDTVLLVSPAVPAQEIAVIDSAVRQGVSHVIKVTSKASADSPVDRRRGQAQIEAHLAPPAGLSRRYVWRTGMPPTRSNHARLTGPGDGSEDDRVAVV